MMYICFISATTMMATLNLTPILYINDTVEKNCEYKISKRYKKIQSKLKHNSKEFVGSTT